jgi:hypothetical protein
MKTTAGKIEMVDWMLRSGFLTSIEEYVNFMESTYTVLKPGVYEVSGSIQMVDGSKNPTEIGLPPGYCIIPWDEDFDNDDNQCKHDWKEYHGFTESFQYCTKCDERRDIDDE